MINKIKFFEIKIVKCVILVIYYFCMIYRFILLLCLKKELYCYIYIWFFCVIFL